MKIRLQDIVKHCVAMQKDCYFCVYHIDGECLVNIDGFTPNVFSEYVDVCGNSPELAKALYTNEEIELHENNSERAD